MEVVDLLADDAAAAAGNSSSSVRRPPTIPARRPPSRAPTPPIALDEGEFGWDTCPDLLDEQTAMIEQLQADQALARALAAEELRDPVPSRAARADSPTAGDHALARALAAEDLDGPRPTAKPGPVFNPATGSSTALVKVCDLADPDAELIDPTPDVHALFLDFNRTFFSSILDCVELTWSKRMTVCAGICRYKGKLGGCSISLSEPLLKLRPRSDMVNTLLHEMIHAYLFLTGGNQDRDGHGADFQMLMHKINAAANTNITVYHTFNDEVAHYKQHWWRCTGPCQNRRPFFGYVKRSMNRAPGPKDLWWSQHQANCDGVFEKIKEPEGFKSRKKTDATAVASGDDSKSTGAPKRRRPNGEPATPATTPATPATPATPPVVPFSGTGNRLDKWFTPIAGATPKPALPPRPAPPPPKPTAITIEDADDDVLSIDDVVPPGPSGLARPPSVAPTPTLSSDGQTVSCPSCRRNVSIRAWDMHKRWCVEFAG